MNRQIHLDHICGLLIIHMALGHIFQFAGLTDCSFYHFMNILFFFMPWFFYKSGMFFKQGKSLKKVALGVGKKLIGQYLIWSVIGQIIFAFMKIASSDFSLIPFFKSTLNNLFYDAAVPGNLALWFLLSLFIVTSFYAWLRKYVSNSFIIVASLMLTSLLYELDVHRPVWLVTTFSGCMFYAMGEYMKDYQYRKKVFAISIIIFMLTLYLKPSFVDFRTMNLEKGLFYLWIPASLGGIITINNIFKNLSNLPILKFIGRNSMGFYVIHWCLLLLAKIIFESTGFENPWLYFCVLCVTLSAGWCVYAIKL